MTLAKNMAVITAHQLQAGVLVGQLFVALQAIERYDRKIVAMHQRSLIMLPSVC